MLVLHEVSKSFGGVRALDAVSFGVERGEVCGLIGPNGAGKTTLFDIISGVQAPTSGRVEIDGVDVTGEAPELRARAGVRRTFQRAQLYGNLSVEDNVLTALEWRGGGGGLVADLVGAPARRRLERDRREQIDVVLDQCGLTAWRGAPAGTLPIGQARLVELARAIADQPQLLLLDEPTSGLSPTELACFTERIDELRRSDLAMVLVEHDMSFVMAQCSRVVVLDLGKVIADGTPAEVQADEQVRSIYLG
jgi:branched-chain amino acid transport system ATP-binding protein